jgi:hypothetical protein
MVVGEDACLLGSFRLLPSGLPRPVVLARPEVRRGLGGTC